MPFQCPPCLFLFLWLIHCFLFFPVSSPCTFHFHSTVISSVIAMASFGAYCYVFPLHSFGLACWFVHARKTCIVHTFGSRAVRWRWRLLPPLCRRALGQAGRWSSHAPGLRSHWGAHPAAPRKTGSVARELSPPQGCLFFAAVAAVRDTLSPTLGLEHPEP